MALWGSQKRYDQDGDGRLNSREWTDWYYGTCGHDLEMAARRKRAQAAKRQPPPPEPIHVFRPEEAWQEIRKTVLGAIPGGAALLREFGALASAGLRGSPHCPLNGAQAGRALRLADEARQKLERQVNPKIVLQLLAARLGET